MKIPPDNYIAELIIANYLDPNLSMGGPPPQYRRRAKEIVQALEHYGFTLVLEEKS